MNEEAMTKEEFVEKYKYGIDPVYGNIVNKKEECLSDLNALLRSELIKHEVWNMGGNLIEDVNELATLSVDEYLKQQQ